MTLDVPTDPARPVFVLGAERSGASLVAELVRAWGAAPGPVELLVPADATSPRGTFEHAPLADLLRDLAAAAETSLWDRDFPTRVGSLADDPALAARAREHARAMAEPGEAWFWKEPLLGFFLPFFQRALPVPPLCLLVVRNPHDAALSFARARLPKDLAGRLRTTATYCLSWSALVRAVLPALEGDPAHAVLVYEELLRSPVVQVQRLCRALAGVSAAAAENGAARLPEMFEGIDPGLWRSKSEVSFFDLPQVAEAHKELLRHLHRRAAGAAEAYEPARFAAAPYHREWSENFDAFRRHLALRNPETGPSERDRRRHPFWPAPPRNR